EQLGDIRSQAGGDRHAEGRPGLVHRAVGPDPRRRLGHPFAVPQGRLSSVAGAGVDTVEAHHRDKPTGVAARFTHMGFKTYSLQTDHHSRPRSRPARPLPNPKDTTMYGLADRITTTNETASTPGGRVIELFP